jgi:hypothetical protein
VSSDIEALDRLLHAEIDALRRETTEAKRQAERAIEVAAEEAAERLSAHNGLIEQMRQQAALFSTREALDMFRDSVERRFDSAEKFQAKLTGALILVSFVGVANLVKVWTG